jgi:hypothetical protein
MTLGMGLSVLALQQSSIWGWDSVATWGVLAAGLAILAAFVRYQLRIENGEAGEEDQQVEPGFRGLSPSEICAYMLAKKKSGTKGIINSKRMMLSTRYCDSRSSGTGPSRVGARPSVVLGCAVAAVGFYPLGQLADRALGLRPVVPKRW